MKKGSTVHHGVGRRKSAVARVWLKHGSGSVSVNGLNYDRYFDTDMTQKAMMLPLTTLGHEKKFDVQANVQGGGRTGQSDAVKVALARALLAYDETHRAALREHGFLTVDARVKERKKYGQKAARKKFQFVKR